MPAQKRGRMNLDSCHVGSASSDSLLLLQSGTEATFGHTVRNASNTTKQTHAQTRITSAVSKSISIHRPDGQNRIDNNTRYVHTEASNGHSSSRIRFQTGKDDGVSSNQAGTPHPDLMGKNLRARAKTRNIGPCPQPCQSNTLSRDALPVDARDQKKTNNDDKKTSKRNMDRGPGFHGGPSTVPARPTRRVQRETGAVPVPVPVKGTRPNPVGSTSIEVGKSGQANQVSRSSSIAIIEREDINRPILHWDAQSAKKRGKKRHRVSNVGRTDIFDVDIDALDAERRRKAAALKNISFSKRVREVKEEAREEEDVLRVGMGDTCASADGLGDESGREATVGEVNGEVGGEKLEQVPSPPPHSPWTWDGQCNIPGLRPSARIHGPQAAGVVNVETKAIPIPLPSLFPDPPDSDISDEELYSQKQVEKAQVQVKEEQREDEDVLFYFDSPAPSSFPDLPTPISAPALEQNVTSELSLPAHAYPLDTECMIHPKNKRKQHNLSHAKNARSPKKAKTEVCALNVGEGQSESNREVVRVQDEEGGRGDVPPASMPAPKKRGKPPKKRKGKKEEKDVVIDQVVVPIGREVPGENEMEICTVDTKQGEIPTCDVLSLAASGAVSTAGPSDSQNGTIGRKESENTGAGGRPENAEQDERVKAGTEISVTPSTDPLLASASVHDATRVTPDLVIRRSSRRGKTKGHATENGAGTTDEVPKRKKKGRGQTTEAGEQTQNHDVNPVGGKEIPHPDNTPRKKRKVKGQATEAGEQIQNNPVGCKEVSHPDETPKKKRKVKGKETEGIDCHVGADPAGDGEEPRPDDMPTKMNDQPTESGERTQRGPAGDEHIPQQEETPRRRTTEGGERTQGGPAVDDHIPQREETARKRTQMNDQMTEGGENIGASSVAIDDIARPDKTPKGKATDKKKKVQTTENIQDSSASSVAVENIARPCETPKRKGKATYQRVTEGAPEAEKKVVRRGRSSKAKKDDEDTNGETSSVKVTEENGPVEEVKVKTPRGRKKRATMDEKDGMTDGVVKKKRVKLALEEVGDGNRQAGKTGKLTVKWMLVCKARTAMGRKASRQGKGKEKAQSTATAPDLDENAFKEGTEGNVKPRKTLKPSIWASSKAELLLVLPELSGSKCFNGITEGSSNFPMVMLDESTAQGICVDVRWFDGEESESSGENPSVRLTLARDFVCPVAEPASTVGIPMDSVAYAAPSDAGPSSQPNVPSSAVPGTSFVLNAYGNGCGIAGPPLPMVLPHDDYDGMDLEYIDESAPQGGAVATFSVPPVNMSPVFLTPIPYTPPVVQAATTAHISYQVQSFSQAPTYHPVIQFGQYNPITLSTPSTISTPSLQFQHLLPFQQHQIPFPDTAPVPIPIPALRIPFYDEKPSPPTPPELKSELDTIIPPNPPPEVEILTSSWRLSLPLILISSHETFKRHFWGPLALPHSNGQGDSPEKVGLAAEHAYVFLGFFRVVKMSQRRVTLSDEERVDLRPGKVAGRVEWTFDVEWDSSYHGSKGSEELSRPWWAPDFVFGRPVGRERGSKKGFTWLEKHAQARLNLLPMQLVDGQEAGSSDEAMPKGWLCKACGKLNQKVMMRHRWCGSRVCRDNPLSRGYAVDLSSARDANQTPLALPINTCNRRTVDVSVADWDDGMRTLKYRPMSIPDRLGNAGERGGILQHVFTCNLVDLQTEATLLFESIQSEVCLMKSTGDSGPLFKSHVSNSYANKRDKYAFSCLSWSEAPQAVKDAKDLMTFMGKYGEEETLDIDHFTIIGWVSSGTRKTPMVLAAREHTIAMLCLGNDVVLTIVPRWEASVPGSWSLQVQQPSNLSYPSFVPPFAPHAEMVIPAALLPSMPVLPRVANFAPPKIRSTLGRTPRAIKPPSANQMQLVDVTAASATENHVQQVGAISENPPSGVVPAQITSGNSRSKPASKVKPKPTQAPESMSVTLVHGDMLLFSGCDFEYSIKRMGTSILVIGSKEDSTVSI